MPFSLPISSPLQGGNSFSVKCFHNDHYSCTCSIFILALSLPIPHNSTHPTVFPTTFPLFHPHFQFLFFSPPELYLSHLVWNFPSDAPFPPLLLPSSHCPIITTQPLVARVENTPNWTAVLVTMGIAYQLPCGPACAANWFANVKLITVWRIKMV